MNSGSRVLAVALMVVAAAPCALRAQQASSPAECHLNYRSNFRLNGAQMHLSVADQSSYEADKQHRADDALRVLTDAANAGSGGGDPLTLWFLMGRAYAIKHDLVGADSSWRRAEGFADAACKAEIARLRHNEAVPIVSAAVDAMQAEHWDSALTAFRRGLLINPSDPSVFVNMGSIYLQLNQDDSAIVYFRRAGHAASDARTEDMRATALFNAGRIAERASNWLLADSIYHEYLQMRPRDAQARASLAGVLGRLGRQSEATAIYDSMLANADSLSSFDLFDTGVALFRQAYADTARADSAAQRALYGKAAHAFELGLHKNPYLRDGIYNLTNAYLAMDDTMNALAAAKRLVAVDGQNSQSLRLLAASYQRVAAGYLAQYRAAQTSRDTATLRRVRPILQAYQDSTVTTLSRSDSLPFEVQISQFQPGDSSATVHGAVQNRGSSDHPAMSLTIEFLDQSGELIASQSVSVPPLGALGGAGSRYDFQVTGTGPGIVAYRYHL